jgi:hypothetical protein
VVHPAELGEGPFAHVVRPRELHAFFRERTRSVERHGPARAAAR